MIELVQGQFIWPPFSRLCDAVEEVVGKSLEEPIVLWKITRGWGSHSIRPDQESLIPKAAIIDLWEVRKVEKTLFPKVGRVYALNEEPKLVFVAPSWWAEEGMQIGQQYESPRPRIGAVRWF